MKRFKLLEITLTSILVILVSIGGIFTIYLTYKLNTQNNKAQKQIAIAKNEEGKNISQADTNSSANGITDTKTNAPSCTSNNKVNSNTNAISNTNSNNVVPVSTSVNSKNVLFYNKITSAKEAALTFDDGPDAKYTPMILDILKQNGVKATFFILGTQASKNPNVVKRIAKEGHAIGNHTWNHPQIPKLTEAQINTQLSSTDNILYSLIGYHTDLFRPPYGAMNNNDIQLVGSMGYKIIDWSVDTRDWAGTSPSQMISYVQKEFRPGGIILQHCSGSDKDMINTINALKIIIKSFKANGYTFVTVPELLNIPASK